MESTAPPPIPDPQAIRDAEHIRLLAVFHYVLAGLMVLAACLAAIYVAMSIVMVNTMSGFMSSAATPPASPGAPAGATAPPTVAPPTEVFEMMAWMYGVMGGLAAVVAIVMAWLLFLAGRYLSACRNRTFIFVIACIECVLFPFGTALGVFTLIVLEREAVKRVFQEPDRAVGSLR